MNYKLVNKNKIVPNTPKIKPFPTLFSDELLPTWQDHIPLFSRCGKHSLYALYLMLAYDYKLNNWGRISSANLGIYSDTKRQFWQHFKLKLIKLGVYHDLFNAGADSVNFTLHGKIEPYYIALVLYKLEHDIPEEDE
ncbi:TPA: hypothetical protein ACN3ZQ_003568 [Vibrio cholerae]